jgi:hypothetical protein
MGLDWCLRKRLDDEQSERLEGLLSTVRSAEASEEERSRARTAVKEALGNPNAKSPLEVIGARRLWADEPETVEAFRRVYDSHQEAIATNGARNDRYAEHWARPFDELVRANEGSVLVDTIPPENMSVIARNLGNPFAAMAGYESFRGKRVQYCELLPDSVQEEASADHEPDEMLAYADRLEQYMDPAILEQYAAAAKRLEEITAPGFFEKPTAGNEKEYERLSEELEEVSYWDHRTIRDAAAWLRFWGNHGFAMWAWY